MNEILLRSLWTVPYASQVVLEEKMVDFVYVYVHFL